MEKRDEERLKYLDNLFTELCQKTAIYHEDYDTKIMYPTIKLDIKNGIIVYIEKSRMKDLVHYNIPNWNLQVDGPLIWNYYYLKENRKFLICESHYGYDTIIMIPDKKTKRME